MRKAAKKLYDHENDPHEWHNLADKSEHDELLMRMRRSLPKHNAEPVIGDWQQWEIDAWRQAEQLGRNSKSKGNQ